MPISVASKKKKILDTWLKTEGQYWGTPIYRCIMDSKCNEVTVSESNQVFEGVFYSVTYLLFMYRMFSFKS